MPAAEPTPPVDPTRSDFRTIHLFRPQNQLGDLLLNVPAIRSIRERFPNARVVLVVGRQNAAAVLGQRWADEIRVVDTRNFFGVAGGGIHGLKGPRPDLAVYFTTVSYSRSAGMLVRWSRARARVGFDPATYRERDRAALTRRVGYPGAGKHENRWPADRFAAVARALIGRGLSVWWLEGPQDGGTVEAATQALGMKLPVVRGESIPMLAARFARAGLYIGNDTGPLHLAGATGCATVGIYGWTDPAEWRPVGRCVRSVRAADGKLESVEPRALLDAALPLLAEERCAVG